MALEDVLLPKEYENTKVLFEQNLDAWREASEQGFFVANLNLTQLAKDCFLTGYQFDNDGNANLSQPLEQRINLLVSGGIPISGTSSDTYTINSDGNAATLSTIGLTTTHTYTFPDQDGEFLLRTANQTASNKIFLDNLVFRSGTAFAGTFDHTNTADRIYTLPDTAGNIAVLPTAATTETGTGSVVRTNSPTLTTPTIADFSNSIHDHQSASGGGVLHIDTATNGQLPVTRGGTGASAVTGTGDNVLSNSPTFTGTLNAAAGNFSGEIALPDIDPPTANRANRNSLIKGFLRYDRNSSNISASYNVASVTDGVAGTFTINWATDFSSSIFVVVGSPEQFVGQVVISAPSTPGTTGVSLYLSGSLFNGVCTIIAVGDQ